MSSPSSPSSAAPSGSRAASFATLGLPDSLVTALASRGITAPSPIQALTLPDSLKGRDISGRAPTGSGKTIAFGLPLVLKVGTATPKRPRGLVLVPTRELASQVAAELQLLGKASDGPWVEAFYGGVGLDRQINWLRRGVDVMVATPGRLGDLIQQRAASLNDVDFVVIDEADRMADMGFLPEVRQILDQCSPDRQTLLFSATLDGDVDILVKRYQKDPARHEQHDENEGDDGAEHFFWSVSTSDRLAVTAQIADRTGPTIIFSRTKHACDRIARQLTEAGVSAAAIHGDRSQAQRERALRSFHKGQVQALVATDVAARGIHVDGVACVVHYDPPADPKDYVHRSGRTARAGAQGVVVTLVLPDKKKDVARLMRLVDRGDGISPVMIEALPRGERIRPAAGAGSSKKKVEREAKPTSPEGTRSQRASKAAEDGAWSTTRPEPKPKAKPMVAETAGSPSAAGSRSFEKPTKPEGTGSSHTFVHAKNGKDQAEAPKPVKTRSAKEAAERPSGAARRKAKKLALAAAIEAGEAVPEEPKRTRRKPPSAPGTSHTRHVPSRRNAT